MREKIYIRADGSLRIGLGHLIRCIALGQMLTSEFEPIFVCREIPESIFSDLNNDGFKVILVGNEEEFFALLSETDIVVLDDYSFDISYQKKVRALAGKLVVIDDLHEMEFSADLIINHAPGVSQSDYGTNDLTQYALGLDYVLLRPAFLKQAGRVREISEINSVMICFGGGDYKNLTLSTLEAVIPFKKFTEISVITGPAYNQQESLNNLATLDSRIKLHQAISEDEMLSVMLNSDLAILPSSGILLEAIAAGCIVISGTYADNQQIIFERFFKSGAFESAGNFAAKDVAKAVNSVLNNSRNSKRLIDGNSGERVMRKFLELTLTLRNVEYGDCALLFDWANEQEVRTNAINSNPINWDDHLKWFDKILSGETTRIFILERSGKPIGQVRFDRKDDHYVIDYSVDKDSRGKGFGKLMLQKSIALSGKGSFKAVVKAENISSAAIFKSLNFKEGANYLDNNVLYYVFHLNI